VSHRRIAATVAVIGLVVASGALAQRTEQAGPTVSGAGVGKVKLDKSYAKLRDAGLVGQLRSGCEFVPGSLAAKLKSPLKGAVNFTTTGAPKAETISVTGGATTKKGIGIGSTKRDVRDAYKSATFDNSTKQVFGIIDAKIPKRSGGKFHIGIDADSKKVVLFGIPVIPFCE
jgi:hypothetical protein